jgi:hypothetical protein
VVAGDTPVLVHNCPGEDSGVDPPGDVYHHFTTNDEITQAIVDTGKLMGKQNRYTQVPHVRAWRGPLPDDGRAGVEFTTPVPSTPGTQAGAYVEWTPRLPGVEMGELDGEEVAMIPINIRRVIWRAK